MSAWPLHPAPPAPHATAPVPAPVSAPAMLPAAGLLLVGTLGTLRALWSAVQTSAPRVVPAGCILAEPAAPDVAAAGAGDLEDLPPILGTLDQLVALHARRRFSFALVSLPPAARVLLPRLHAGLARLGIPARTVPTLEDLLGAQANAADDGAISAHAHASASTSASTIASPAPALRLTPSTPSAPAPIFAGVRVDPAQLIGRVHHAIDQAAVSALLAGKRVLITGAGGSIGSELARLAARFQPAQLLLVERSENALFTIDHELAARAGAIPRTPLLHDVVDAEQTLRLCLRHRPQVIFHAAAHKHVPLLEDHPAQAVVNNVFGTMSIADAALAAGAERFVLISTDKAVRPSSVMGATKRLAELYLTALAAHAAAPAAPSTAPESPASAPATRLCMVRFGNVLGSAGSVIPIWMQQIADGGPLTVTDPRMTRYFMTIPEAAALVAQAAALTPRPGVAPVYVLDMGQPVNVLDMALRLIRRCGLRPILDPIPDPILTPPADTLTDSPPDAPTIRVRFSGIRPGEKLVEQLAYASELLAPTAHPGIRCWTADDHPPAFPPALPPAPATSPITPHPDLAARLRSDLEAVRALSTPRRQVLAAIRRYVPELPEHAEPDA